MKLIIIYCLSLYLIFSFADDDLPYVLKSNTNYQMMNAIERKELATSWQKLTLEQKKIYKKTLEKIYKPSRSIASLKRDESYTPILGTYFNEVKVKLELVLNP